MTTINSRAGVSCVLDGTTLTVTVYDTELHPAIYDEETGEVGDLDPGGFEVIEYDGGLGSLVSSTSAMRDPDSEFDIIRDLMPALDPTAEEIV